MMRRLREIIDWRFILATALLALVVELGFNSWSDAQANQALVTQMKQDHVTWDAERRQASKERQRLLDSQQQLRRDYQLLLDYLEAEGITVPPNLARAIVAGSGRTNNDDDDGTTRIEVRPNSGSTSSPSSSPSPSGGGSSDPPNVVEELPKQIGGTVDDTRKQIEDLTDGLGSMVELP